ncbi:MAG: chitobiase/beta-hexosaminidase C-terminal domain-containing protein [Verrucomicrobiota bacterium]|nr:chitobiase/beta-hexosaminidase C-terminal domain-containing protein [Verrucomicrobiota bacterium]
MRFYKLLLIYLFSPLLLLNWVTSESLAAAPAWWFMKSVIADGSDQLDPQVIESNYAPANLGQAKNMAYQAFHYMETMKPGSTGTAIRQMVESFSTIPEDNYAPLLLGQLKALSAPFYNRFKELNYSVLGPIVNGQGYPWGENTPVAENYHPANIGQVKYVFSFDLSAWAADDFSAVEPGIEVPSDEFIPQTVHGSKKADYQPGSTTVSDVHLGTLTKSDNSDVYFVDIHWLGFLAIFGDHYTITHLPDYFWVYHYNIGWIYIKYDAFNTAGSWFYHTKLGWLFSGTYYKVGFHNAYIYSLLLEEYIYYDANSPANGPQQYWLLNVSLGNPVLRDDNFDLMNLAYDFKINESAPNNTEVNNIDWDVVPTQVSLTGSAFSIDNQGIIKVADQAQLAGKDYINCVLKLTYIQNGNMLTKASLIRIRVERLSVTWVKPSNPQDITDGVQLNGSQLEIQAKVNNPLGLPLSKFTFQIKSYHDNTWDEYSITYGTPDLITKLINELRPGRYYISALAETATNPVYSAQAKPLLVTIYAPDDWSVADNTDPLQDNIKDYHELLYYDDLSHNALPLIAPVTETYPRAGSTLAINKIGGDKLQLMWLMPDVTQEEIISITDRYGNEFKNQAKITNNGIELEIELKPNILIEAEAAAGQGLFAPLQVHNIPDESGAYIIVDDNSFYQGANPPQSALASYNFNLAYRRFNIWGRILLGNNYKQNNFWLKLDSDDWMDINLFNLHLVSDEAYATNWHWYLVKQAGINGGNHDNYSVNVNAGEHVIKFSQKRGSLGLDSLLVTTDLGFNPELGTIYPGSKHETYLSGEHYSYTLKIQQPNQPATSVDLFFKVDQSLPVVKANVAEGRFSSDFDVTLMSEPSAKIYYSLDESYPTVLYTSGTSLRITSTTLLRYYAIDPAGNVGPTGQSYYIKGDELSAPTELNCYYSGNQANLSWSAPNPATGITGYYIYRAISPLEIEQMYKSYEGKYPLFHELKYASVTGTSFSDANIEVTGTVHYAVAAVQDVSGKIQNISWVCAPNSVRLTTNTQPTDLNQATKRGLQWLLAQQNTAGYWGNTDKDRIISTAAALQALSANKATMASSAASIRAGLAYLQGQMTQDITAIASATRVLQRYGIDPYLYHTRLSLYAYTVEGTELGWGRHWRYLPDPYDSALALLARKESQSNWHLSENASISAFLRGDTTVPVGVGATTVDGSVLQSINGTGKYGWSPKNTQSTFVSTFAYQALAQDHYTSADKFGWILNDYQGTYNPNTTIYDSVALLSPLPLADAIFLDDKRGKARAHLLEKQLADGSWSDVYTTALCLKALIQPRALFVYNNEETDVYTIASDAKIRELLRARGFIVINSNDDPVTDDENTAIDLNTMKQFLSTVEQYDLVVFSNNLQHNEFSKEWAQIKWAKIQVPVIAMNDQLFRLFGLVRKVEPEEAASSGVFDSYDPEHLLFTDNKVLRIVATSEGHPLTAGYLASSANIALANHGWFFWGYPGQNAVTIAEVADQPDKKLIFGYEPGALLQNGTRAPSRRLAFPFTDNFNVISPQGKDLFDAAIQWTTAKVYLH